MPPSPTPRLLIGLTTTLIAVAVFCLYSLRQLAGLRQLQANTIDRASADSRQLLRIDDGLQALGLAMNDMAAGRAPSRQSTWTAEFDVYRRKIETALAYGTRRERLGSRLRDMWSHLDRAAALADAGQTARAAKLVMQELEARQHAIAANVSAIIVENEQLEEDAEREIANIYDRSERNTYLFALGMLAAIAIIGIVMVQDVRRLFRRLEKVSEQRRTLARQLLDQQEEFFRSISRDLHDDFGQVLTAVGALLQRAGKKGIAPESPLREDLNEVIGIVQETLDRTRSFSQSLHPSILDDHGLERAIDRYLPAFQKQTGISVRLERDGDGSVPQHQAIHVYRVLQEALTNVAKHSNASTATVRLLFRGGRMELEVEDNGVGIRSRSDAGLGLIAMRERAGLAGGELQIRSAATGGTLINLEIPLKDGNS